MPSQFTSEIHQAAVQAVGHALAGWVLDLTSKDVVEALSGSLELAAGQVEALDRLTALVLQAQSQREQSDPSPPLRFFLGGIGTYSERLANSQGNAFRVLSGGEIPHPHSQDPVGGPLQRMIIDSYPALLLPSGEWSEIWDQPGNLYAHPLRDELWQAALEDPDLTALYPDRPEKGIPSGFTIGSTGRGGTQQVAGLAETLVRQAWSSARLQSEVPTIDDLLHEADDLLDHARKLARGETVNIRALVGVAGYRLPEGTEIDLGWGVLRSIRPEDQWLVPTSLKQSDSGDGVTIAYGGEIVFDCQLRYSIEIREPHDDPALNSFDVSTSRELQRRLYSLQLGAALATDDRDRFVTSTWHAVLEPLAQSVSVGYADPRRGRKLSPNLLTDEEAAKWSTWSKAALEHCGPTVRIAQTRTLLAISSRDDPTDSLIDTVTALENLFGSGAGELTLRISSSVAWLLGQDLADRIQRQKEVRKIYELRSKILHGALDPTGDITTVVMSNSALDVVLDVWRKLLTDRTDLLDEATKSHDRSARLIVGG